MKKNIEIVLVDTQLPENLGSVTRGMLNFGLEKFFLIIIQNLPRLHRMQFPTILDF